jgi:hypothetical protein
MLDRLDRWLTVLTNIGVILGLALVAYQISQTNESLDIDRQDLQTGYRWERTQTFSEFFMQIAADPVLSRIWNKGVTGEPLDEEENVRWVMLSNQLFWLWWNSDRNELAKQGLLGPEPSDPNGALRIPVRELRRSPGLRRAFEVWQERNRVTDFTDRIEVLEETY